MEGIKIDLKEYEKFFPDSGSVRINHCKEGDSNRKFYLTRRDEDGIILGYCHHCGGSGSYRLANTRKVRSRKANERDGTINGSDSECDGTDSFKKWGVPKLQDWHKCERWQEPEFSELPIEIRRWWFKNNCSINDYKSIGIKMLDGKTLAIPLFLGTSDTDPSGLAIRPLQKNLPKWILLGNKNQAPMGKYNSKNCAKILKPMLILTEDYISAFRCSRYINAMPLMGVNFSDWHFSKVVEWRKAVLDSRHDGVPMGDGIVLVWLDNDSRLVVNKARDIYKRLTNIVHTTIVKGTKEPKHFIHNHELEEYIWNQI